VDTFNYPSLFQFALGYPTYTVGAEVSVSGLNTSQAAQVFVALFFPLSYEVLVSDIFIQTIFI